VKAYSGSLFVFEGPDGVGKTTLVSGVADALQAGGHQTHVFSFPGKEPRTLGSHVYALHHDPMTFGISAMTAESLQVLHVAAHLDAIDRLIRPRVQAGDAVLLDRYWWSTWVYGISGGARRATIDAAVACERTHWDDLCPSALFLISRQNSLRRDEEGPAWHTRVRLYGELVAKEDGKYPIYAIPNDHEPTKATEVVLRTIRRHLDSSPQ